MESISALTKGLKEGRRRWRLTIIIYTIQLMMALTIGLQVYQVIASSIGHSMSVEEIIDGYNHTVLRDFINVHGSSLATLIGQLRWFVAIYLVVSAFVHAGLLGTITKNGDDWLEFWGNGACFFRPFFLISIIHLVIFTVWTLIILIPVLLGLFPAIESLNRETPIYYGLGFSVILWLIGVGFIYLLSFYSKWHIIESGRGIRKAIWRGWKFTLKHLRSLILIIGILAVLTSFIWIANYWLELTVGIRTEILILIFIFIQQAVVLGRIYLRVSGYCSLHHFASHS